MEAALQQAGASIPSREAGQAFFKMLFTILKNVAEHPSEPKYRSVKLANKGFHAKVGQHAGGVECMKALGFAETADGRLELALVWGLPDTGKLREGYAAMSRTAEMLGVPAPAISFDAPAAADTPGAGAAAPAPPASAAPDPELPTDGSVRTFNVRDSRKYQVGIASTFRSRDGNEVSGVVMALTPLPTPNPEAPHAARATVLVDETPAPSSSGAPPPMLNLNTESRLAPSGWAAQKQARLEGLREAVLGVVPRAADAPERELSYGVGSEQRVVYRTDGQLLGSVAAQQQAKSGGAAVGWVQAGQETRQQEEEGKLNALAQLKTTSIRFRLPGGENLAVSADFSSNEPASVVESFVRQSLLVPGFSGAVPLLLRPPIPPRQLDLSATGGELGEGASSLMAFGREWKARHEYTTAGRRIAWSYTGQPKGEAHTLAPRAQLIMAVEPAQIRAEVMAAAVAAAEEESLARQQSAREAAGGRDLVDDGEEDPGGTWAMEVDDDEVELAAAEAAAREAARRANLEAGGGAAGGGAGGAAMPKWFRGTRG